MNRLCSNVESLQFPDANILPDLLEIDATNMQSIDRAAELSDRLATRYGKRCPALILSAAFRGCGGLDTSIATVIAKGNWDYVELAYGAEMPQTIEAALTAKARLIRVLQDDSGWLLDLPFSKICHHVMEFSHSCREDSAIPKLVLYCRSSRDLLVLCRISLFVKDEPEKILLGLGEYGFAARVLSVKLGSLWGYAQNTELEDFIHLYRFRNIVVDTPIYGIIGNPVSHSRSPHLHNRWLQDRQLEGSYIPIRSDDLGATLEACDILGICGLSVTVPHKEKALIASERADELTRKIAAANTLVRRPEGWWAFNTDVYGFMASLKDALNRLKLDLHGLKVLVIGAGGAAKAAVHGLSEAGANLVILNRTLNKATDLASMVGATAGLLSDQSLDLLKEVKLIVQTTTVGMSPNEDDDPIDWWDMSGCLLVYDMIYVPKQTALLKRAANTGITTVNGQSMLEKQGHRQFAIFTDLPIKPTV